MDNKKGMAGGLVALTVTLVIGMILLIGVLVPVTNSAVNNVNVTGGALGFTGTNATIANNFVTFILVGALVLVAGLAMFGMGKK